MTSILDMDSMTPKHEISKLLQVTQFPYPPIRLSLTFQNAPRQIQTQPKAIQNPKTKNNLKETHPAIIFSFLATEISLGLYAFVTIFYIAFGGRYFH